MKKIHIFSIILAILAFFTSSAFADTSVTNKYQVSLTKFELFNSGTNQWVTLYEGNSVTLDIASVSVNQAVGNFMSGLSVPDGTYTKARATPSTTFVIKGSVTSGGTTYYTTATTLASGGRTVSSASTTASDEADCTIAILTTDVAPNTDGVSFSSPLTITDGNPNKKIRVKFDLSNTLVYVAAGPNNLVYPGPPTVTMTLE
mgnify:CR=1 FL=1